MNEFAIEWIRGDKEAYITMPSSTKLKSTLKKLAENYPDEVHIIKENEDGSILAKLPVKYISIRHPRRVSDEQREAARLRMKTIHNNKGE